MQRCLPDRYCYFSLLFINLFTINQILIALHLSNIIIITLYALFHSSDVLGGIIAIAPVSHTYVAQDLTAIRKLEIRDLE